MASKKTVKAAKKKTPKRRKRGGNDTKKLTTPTPDIAVEHDQQYRRMIADVEAIARGMSGKVGARPETVPDEKLGETGKTLRAIRETLNSFEGVAGVTLLEGYDPSTGNGDDKTTVAISRELLRQLALHKFAHSEFSKSLDMSALDPYLRVVHSAIECGFLAGQLRVHLDRVAGGTTRAASLETKRTVKQGIVEARAKNPKMSKKSAVTTAVKKSGWSYGTIWGWLHDPKV